MRAWIVAAGLAIWAFGCSEQRPTSHQGVACPEGTHVHLVTYGPDSEERETMWCMQSDGTREGPHRSWFRNGQLSRKGQYDQDVRLGRWTYYHPNGQPKVEGEYGREGGARIEGQRNGPWIGWDEDGNKVWMQLYRIPGEHSRAVRYEQGRPVECYVGFTKEPCPR